MPGDKDKVVEFTKHFKKIEHPFAVYADFGYFVKPDVPCACSYFIKCSLDEKYDKYESFIGKNAVAEFTEELVKDLTNLYEKVLAVKKPMIELTDKERNAFDHAEKCQICEIKFKDDDIRAQSYCHSTGKYRGAAHKTCNLKYKVHSFFPVIFADFSRYDCHHLAKSLDKFRGPISVIPHNDSNYISLTKRVLTKGNKSFSIKFLNSTRFLQSSLDLLAENLSVDLMVYTKKYFPNDDKMLRKCVFPNCQLDSWDRLDEPIEKFHNSLIKSECSDADYEHAKTVWSHFKCASLKYYLLIYMKSKVLFLTDFFEYFRNLCRSVYGLDACHYLTSAGLSWDAMLKTTGRKLELLTEVDKYDFFNASMRGGLCQCSHRYAVANNKYLTNYSKTEPSQYLMFYDANNAYGWAMSEPLPIGDFQWDNANLSTYTQDYISKLNDEGIGYVLEVDLIYPKEKHNEHNDLPFCPEKTQRPGSAFYNLTANLNHKKRYTIHLKNLQQCIKHGLVLKKVHRVLKFKQSRWLQPYIQLNTDHRTAAKNAFEKNFFKFMNNCIYGKTIENMENRSDIQIVRDWDNKTKPQLGGRWQIAHPNFVSSEILIDGMAFCKLKKTHIKRDKPIYVGFVVLELSKWLMYDFHYDYMKKKYKEFIRINYTDTDSFMYSIWTDDFYADIIDDVKNSEKPRFDTLEYPKDNPHKFPQLNGKVPGLFKDVTNCKKIVEFVGLKAKTYCYKLDDGNEVTKPSSSKDNLKKVNDYRKRLKEEVVRPLNVSRDTKRNIDGCVATYAWGHYRISKFD